MINNGFLNKDFAQLLKVNDDHHCNYSKPYLYFVHQEHLQHTLKDQLPFGKTLSGYINMYNVFLEKLLLAYL